MSTKVGPSGETSPYSFVCGSIQDKRVIRVVAQIDALTRSGSDETEVMMLDLMTRKWLARDVEFRVISLATQPGNPPTLFAMGMRGDLMVGNSQGAWEEHVDDSDAGPRRRGDIRTVRIVGSEVLAAGMGRQVYRRVGKRKWERADDGLVQARGELTVSGINAIDGAKDGSLVAVGFMGEIWARREGRWSAVDSPTNLVLHDVKVVDTTTTYCTGQQGLILVDRGSGWEKFDQDSTATDIWAIERFCGKTYFGSEEGLFVMDDDERLERVDLGRHSADPVRDLHADGSLLLAVATKGVLINRGGPKWEDVSP